MTSGPRRTARIATVGALALMTGFMPGVGAASDTQAAEAEVAYTCDSPSGSVQVKVKVEAELPITTDIGTPIQVRGVDLSFALPRSALSDLPGIDSALVSGSARVVTEVSQRGKPRPCPGRDWRLRRLPFRLRVTSRSGPLVMCRRSRRDRAGT